MATRPTDDTPRWATGGSAEVVTPKSAKQDVGWLDKEKPPHNLFNWLHKVTYDWLEFFRKSAGSWDEVWEFIQETERGDTGIVSLTPSVLWATVSNLERQLDFVEAVWSDGFDLYTISGIGQSVESQSLEDAYAAGSTTVVYGGGTGAGRAIVANGTHLAAAIGDFVHCWELGNTIELWNFDHGAAVRGLAMDRTHVYMVGDDGDGSKQGRRIEITALSGSSGDGDEEGWVANGGFALHQTKLTNDHWIVAGDSASGSGIDYMERTPTGAASVNVSTNAQDCFHIATDQFALYSLEKDAPDVIRVRDLFNGSEIGVSVDRGVQLPGIQDGAEIVVDDRFLYLPTTGSIIWVYDKRHLHVVHQFDYDNSGGTTIQALDGDGRALYVGGAADPTGAQRSELWITNIAQHSRVWERHNEFSMKTRYGKLASPSEG